MRKWAVIRKAVLNPGRKGFLLRKGEGGKVVSMPADAWFSGVFMDIRNEAVGCLGRWSRLLCP